jgi:hypothetical protein
MFWKTKTVNGSGLRVNHAKICIKRLVNMEFFIIYGVISVLAAGYYVRAFFVTAITEFMGEEGALELSIRLYAGLLFFAFMLVFWPIFVATDTRE